MDKKTKILIALAVGGTALLVFSQRGSSVPQNKIPPAIAKRVLSYSGDMLRYGVEQGVNPALIASVITVESGGDAAAHGAAGEVGLMQILPSTGMWIGNATQGELTVPEINIRVGTAYIRYCVDRKGGNVLAGIAGYNYGPDRVRVQPGKVIAPVRVLEYAMKVLGYVDAYRRLLTEQMGNFYTIAFPTNALVTK